MQSHDCPNGVLQPILDRINLATLGSPSFYRNELSKLGFSEVKFVPLTEQLQTHYARVRTALVDSYGEVVKRSGRGYVDNMVKGLEHLVNGADKRHLGLHARGMTWGTCPATPRERSLTKQCNGP